MLSIYTKCKYRLPFFFKKLLITMSLDNAINGVTIQVASHVGNLVNRSF